MMLINLFDLDNNNNLNYDEKNKIFDNNSCGNVNTLIQYKL